MCALCVRKNRPLVMYVALCLSVFLLVDLMLSNACDSISSTTYDVYSIHMHTNKYNQFIQNDVYDKYFTMSSHSKKLFKSFRDI